MKNTATFLWGFALFTICGYSSFINIQMIIEGTFKGGYQWGVLVIEIIITLSGWRKIHKTTD